MTSKLMSAALALLFVASSGIASANDLASQLTGVWKLKAYDRKYVDGGEATKPYGDNPHGIATFSKGGHMVFAMHAGGRKAPAPGQTFTEAEMTALMTTAFFGSGMYKVEGDKGLVIINYDASLAPSFVNSERRATMTVTDNKILTWIGPEFKDEKGKAFHNVFTFNRLE